MCSHDELLNSIRNNQTEAKRLTDMLAYYDWLTSALDVTWDMIAGVAIFPNQPYRTNLRNVHTCLSYKLKDGTIIYTDRTACPFTDDIIKNRK